MSSPISKVIERVNSVKERVMRDSNSKSAAEASLLSNSHTKTDIRHESITDEQPGEQPRKRITWKRVLYHPLTWIAVGLHVVLLVVPFNPAPPAAIEPAEETEETDEAIPIDLLNLSEIATSEPPPPPAAEPPPSNAPPIPQQAAPPPAAAPAPTPAPNSEAPAAPVAPEPTPAQPTAPTPDPTTQPTQPAYDPSGDQQLFVQNLGAIGLNTYDLNAFGLPSAREFKEPANAPAFLNGDSPVPNAKSVQQIDKEPGDVFSQVQSSYASTGITFTQEPAYGGEELYHAITPNGDTLMYFSLVRLQGSTLLVIWNEKPA